jgi:hypothetical protein
VGYYENMQRALAQIAQALDLPGPGSFTDSDISKQPMGNVFISLRNLFSRVSDELTNSTLPNLREKQVLLQKTVTRVDGFQRSLIGDLRRYVQQYETENDQIVKWKRQMTTTKDFVQSMADFGQRSHANCQRFYEAVAAAEQTAVQELKRAEDFQKLLISQEDGVVGGVSEMLINGLALPGPERTMPRRVISPDESVWAINAQIASLLLELKSFVGSPRSFSNEFAPKIWEDEAAIQPFFARVWDSRRGGGDELHVQKRELVQVMRAPNALFWFVKKISGEEGYVPAAILEPVD